jgi:hypothetical protein
MQCHWEKCNDAGVVQLWHGRVGPCWTCEKGHCKGLKCGKAAAALTPGVAVVGCNFGCLAFSFHRIQSGPAKTLSSRSYLWLSSGASKKTVPKKLSPFWRKRKGFRNKRMIRMKSPAQMRIFRMTYSIDWIRVPFLLGSCLIDVTTYQSSTANPHIWKKNQIFRRQNQEAPNRSPCFFHTF